MRTDNSQGGVNVRRWTRLLLVPLLLLLTAVPASAAGSLPGSILTPPILVNPGLLQPAAPIPVAFGAIANKYTGVDPATVFDLNGDLVGDVKVTATEVLGQNGAQVQLLNPQELNLDNVQQVPAAGYSAKATLQLSRVYVAKLSGDGYAKFMILQASPKVTIWFMYGTPTSSVLKADGTGSHAVLTWTALPDAALGYNIYRYEVGDSSYTVTQLNDFTVQETTFTDNTAASRYYIYIVQAMKAGGAPGGLTTAASVFVQSQAHSLVVGVNANTAKLDGANVSLAVKTAVKDGLFMVPASLLTRTGAEVTVDGRKVTLSRRLDNVTYTVVMTVDSADYTWNGTAYKTDVPPYKQGAEVMVPLRTVAPVLGLGVTFNSTDRTATIGWYE